jgi:hypothetical protein
MGLRQMFPVQTKRMLFTGCSRGEMARLKVKFAQIRRKTNLEGGVPWHPLDLGREGACSSKRAAARHKGAPAPGS